MAREALGASFLTYPSAWVFSRPIHSDFTCSVSISREVALTEGRAKKPRVRDCHDSMSGSERGLIYVHKHGVGIKAPLLPYNFVAIISHMVNLD